MAHTHIRVSFLLFLLIFSTVNLLVAQTGDELVLQAEDQYRNNAPDSALALYQMAEESFSMEGNFGNQIDCLLDKASLILEMGDIEVSYACIEKAEGIYKEKKLTDVKKSTLINFAKGELLLYQEKIEESTSILNSTINQLDKDQVAIADLSNAYNNLATCYYFKGQYDKSIPLFEEALRLNKEIKSNDGISTNLNNLGALYQVIGDYEKAASFLHEAMEFDQVLGVEENMGFYLSNIGDNYLRLGQYKKSMEFMQQALHFDRKAGTDKAIAADLNNLGYVFRKLNQSDSAINYISKAALAFRKLSNPMSEARCLDNLGDIYRQNKEYQQAENYLWQANALFHKYEHNKDLATNWNNLARLYSEMMQFDKAIEKCYNALELNKEIKAFLSVAASYNRMGQIFLAQDSIATALGYFHLAVASLVDVGKDVQDLPKQEELPYELELIQALKNKASCFVDLSKQSDNRENFLLAGLQHYLKAIELIDAMRISYQADDKLVLSQSEKSTFDSALKTAKLLYDLTGDKKYAAIAFEVSERSKAAHLYELIREYEGKLYSSIPDSLLLKEKLLKSETFEFEKKLQQEKLAGNDSAVDVLEELIFANKHDQLDGLLKHFEQEYPDYYEIKYDNKILSIEAIRKNIKKKECLIEYSLGSDFLAILFISDDSLAFIVNEIDSCFFKDINNMQDVLSNVVQSVDIFESYAATSHSLYNLLISPIESLIEDKSLIIVPDGVLGYIPFETLLTEKVDVNEVYYKAAPYLILDHAISYAYSATLLFKPSRRQEQQAGKDLLAIAPSFNPGDNLPTFITERGEEFIDLVGSKIEVSSINKIFRGEQQLDSLATEQNFKTFAGNYKILHIATHGLIDDKDPMNSRLLFYRNSDPEQDGNLYTYELFNMQLNAELAVLSACNTGYGKLEEGEGIISLARGFLFAGVPSIVMTLWCVPDGTSAMIVEHFYKYLKEGYPKDMALQKAKLDYLNQADNLKSNPYFWAGFVNIGNTDPFTPQQLGNWYFVAISGFILLLLILVWRKLRREAA